MHTEWLWAKLTQSNNLWHIMIEELQQHNERVGKTLCYDEFRYIAETRPLGEFIPIQKCSACLSRARTMLGL